MSDDISLGYSNTEVLKLVLGNTGIAEPVHPYQLQWMAHWTQGSGSACVQTRKHRAGTNETKVQRGRCRLPVESTKQSYHSECLNSWKCELGKQDHLSYMLHSLEAQGVDNRRFKIVNNSVFQNGINPSGSVSLGKLSKRTLPASSVNWEKFSSCQFQNSRGSKAEWSQFPMFDINRKLETLMAPRSKSSNTKAPLVPHLIEFVSEESHPSGQNMVATEKEIGPSESLEGPPDYNFHRPSMASSMETDEEDDHFRSGLAFKENFANANLSYPKHELSNDSKHSAGIVSKIDKKNLRYAGGSQTRLKDRSHSCPGDVPCAFLSKECNKGREDVCDRSKTTFGVNRLNKMSSCSMHIKMGEPETCQSDAQYSLVRKQVGLDFSQKGESTTSVKTKGTAFFEKLTLPTMSYHHVQQGERSTLVRSINNMKGVHGVNIQFTAKDNGASVKTDTMPIDVDETPSCPEVGSSAESQKIPWNAVRRNLTSSEKADADSSRSESMDAFLKRPSNPTTEDTPRGSEPSCKWVKRLRPNPLDDIPFSGKRFKMGDPSPSGEMKNLLTRVVNYNRSISELPDYQQLEKTTLVPKNNDCSPIDSAKVIPWIRRWCKNGQDTALPAPVLCEPENSKVSSEKFEAKQFPSLAAMALMGKQVINFRPCEFRKRGATVVWNV